ncbi:purine-nucleoside phosphorylase [[Eubacterium] hominis]|uniref:purine-nucleoside phosphorylase n=1 Tax=[Eubacterium] hominis TaxID=2764325 RepID=UPI003A4D6A44
MFYDLVKESAEYIKEFWKEPIDVAIILGSGLGGIVDIMKDKKILSYKEIPNFPQSHVKGHEGNLVFGNINGTCVMAMQGRFHYYEGFSMKEVAYPVYVMKLLGITDMIITNACGGINTAFHPGDLMIIDDFINSVGTNPLFGQNDERFGPRFPDMSEPFSCELREKAMQVAKELQLPYQRGVYTLFQGPYYETAAEIRMFAKLGSDAIGMSTVPETIAANYLGIKVLGIACITNMATGIRKEKHSHEEVLQMANASSEKLCLWIQTLLEEWKK